jgi:hypothetical protein
VASTHAILRSPVYERNYVPILNRVEISGNNSAAFHITFVQVAAGTQAVVRDKSVARIFTALNLAHRFRWEIIDPYSDLDRLQQFIEHHTSSAADGGNDARANNGSGLCAVLEMIELLETESRNRGVYDPVALPADFGPRAERISEMFSIWKVKREQLEQAAQSADAATFARVLAELDPINVEFISLAGECLGELVRAGAHTGHGDSQPALNRAA